jgi:peptidyl-prolyl cis-trans isomerase D
MGPSGLARLIEERAPMMNLFRRGGGGQWIVAAIATVIIVVFVVEFRTGRGPTNANLEGDCAIKVNNNCLGRKEFFASYGLIVPQGVSAKQIKAMKLPDLVVDGLIERELLVTEAEKLGIGVGDNDLDAELTQGRAHISLPVLASDLVGSRLGLCIPDPMTYACVPSSHTFRTLPVKRVQDGKFDAKIYERVVRTYTNRGQKQFREMQMRELIAARMRDIVRGRVRVSPDEAFEIYKRQASTATVEYITLDRDWFARYVVDLSPTVVENWTSQHKDQIDDAIKSDKDRFVAGCTLVSEIVFPFENDASDADKATLRGKVDAALERITKGHEPFATVARQVSKGDQALSGGYLGCLNESYGTGAKELMDAAAQLKDNEISSVVESARGFHVLRREGKLNEADVNVTLRRAAGMRLAARFLADESMQTFATKLHEQAKNAAVLQSALDALLPTLVGAPKNADKLATLPALLDDTKPRVKNSAAFTVDAVPGPEFSPYSAIGAKIFAVEKEGDLLPAPVPTSQGTAIVRLVAKHEATRDAFDKEGASLVERMRAEKGREALSEYVARLRKLAAASIKVEDGLRNLKIRGSDE